MDRREFLATGATLAIATAGGCTGCAQAPSASLRMDPISDAEIAEEVTYRLGDGPSDRRRLVADAVENGSATVEDTDPPFPADRSFVYDGAVYRLSVEVVESVPATRFHFTLNPVEESESIPDSETIRYENLPAVDKKHLGYDGDVLGFGSSMRYLDSEVPDSALVPEPDHSVIVWDSETKGRFEVDSSTQTALETYRYESERVHPSAAAYGERVREEYAFALSELTSAERDIVAKGIVGQDGSGDGGYSVPADESPTDAMWNLATRFRPHGEVRHAWEDAEYGEDPPDGERTAAGDDGGDSRRISGTYLVRYDGEVYWTEIRVSREAFTTTG